MQSKEKLREEVLDSVTLVVNRVLNEEHKKTEENEDLVQVDFSELPDFYKTAIDDYISGLSVLEIRPGNFHGHLSLDEVPSSGWVERKCYIPIEDSKWGVVLRGSCKYVYDAAYGDYALDVDAGFEVLDYDCLCGLYKSGEEAELLTDYLYDILHQLFSVI